MLEVYSSSTYLFAQGGKRIVDISAGSTHAAAIDEDGQVYTWGNGGSWWSGGGQLGHGVRAIEPIPKYDRVLHTSFIVKIDYDLYTNITFSVMLQN